MAASVYTNGIIAQQKGGVDLLNDDIVVMFVDTDVYTPDFDTDLVQSDIPEAARIGEYTLLNKNLDGSTFRADPLQVTGLSSGKVGAMVVLNNTGELTTSQLLAYLEAPEFPIEPDGTLITINWDTGIEGIFRG